MKKNILVIGATGATGKELIELAGQNENIGHIHLLHYRPTLMADGTRILEHIWPFEKLSEFRLEDDVDIVFSCIGTTIKKAGSQARFAEVDRDFVIALARWSKQREVESFHVISYLGADKNSSIFYNRVKGEMEEGVIELGLKSCYIYHPPLLSAKRNEFRFGESIGNIFLSIFSPLMIGGLAKYRPLSVRKMAKKMLENALSPLDGLHYVTSEEMHGFK